MLYLIFIICKYMKTKEQAATNFYIKYGLNYGFDNRTHQEIKNQQKKVNDTFARNLAALKIELSDKKSIKYNLPKIEKIQFEDGWYCYISDNKIFTEQTIFTIHGAPGNHTSWAGLQTEMKEKYRWVNFIIPGYDGQDERRGSYDGLRTSLFALIFKLINKLNLKRITLCCFSFGSSIGYDLISRYPLAFEGFINIAGLCNYWFHGLTFIYQSVVLNNNYHEESWKMKKQYEKDETRQIIYKKYCQDYRQSFEASIGIPYFQKKQQYFTYYKLTYQHPKQFEQLLKRIRQLQFFRVNIYSTNDHYHIKPLIQSTIYDLLFAQSSYLKKPYYQKLFTSMKQPLEQKLRQLFGVEICGDLMQQYFCFNFEDTGHSINKRRPMELSKIIQIYMVCLQVKYLHENLICSKI